MYNENVFFCLFWAASNEPIWRKKFCLGRFTLPKIYRIWLHAAFSCELHLPTEAIQLVPETHSLYTHSASRFCYSVMRKRLFNSQFHKRFCKRHCPLPLGQISYLGDTIGRNITQIIFVMICKGSDLSRVQIFLLKAQSTSNKFADILIGNFHLLP